VERATPIAPPLRVAVKRNNRDRTKGYRMLPPFEPMAAAGPLQPLLQRGQYARQRMMTLGDLLLENRIVFVGASPDTGGSPVITDFLASVIIQRLLFLQYENKTADIYMYINSPGGSVSATLAVYDTMQFLEAPIHTFCMGLAASGAAILLTAGAKGRRYCLPNSKVMIHQPYGQVGGQVSDIEIQANEILKERQRLNEILVAHTGQPLSVIEKETDRDKYFHAHEAKAFGLVDEVLTKAEGKK
jgi:ATP-dependent Clp protease protease subunit